MHFAWFRSTFLRLLTFPQIKAGGANFLGVPTAEQPNYLVALSLFQFKIFKDPNSSSFIRFQCILHDSGIPFSGFWNFYKLKWGNLISWEEPILQSGQIIWSTLLFFTFKSFKDATSSSFIRFQCILHDSGLPFSACEVFTN